MRDDEGLLPEKQKPLGFMRRKQSMCALILFSKRKNKIGPDSYNLKPGLRPNLACAGYSRPPGAKQFWGVHAGTSSSNLGRFQPRLD